MGSLKRVAVLCGFTLLFAATAQAEDWQVAKDEDGIKVSLSEIAGSKYKAYRGVTVIKAPLAKVQALQEDVVGACAWIHECKSQKRKLEGVPTYKPEAKGYVRVAQVEGFWKLVPKGDNQTEVTYQVHTEPGGSVPSWLANKFVVDAPFNTLKALKEHAEK